MVAVTFVSCGTLISSNTLKSVFMSIQECKIKATMVNINSLYFKSLFYPYNVLVNKCSSSCNDINNPYAKLCVPDVDKNTHGKVFNLMLRTNEIRYIKKEIFIHTILFTLIIIISCYYCNTRPWIKKIFNVILIYK